MKDEEIKMGAKTADEVSNKVDKKCSLYLLIPYSRVLSAENNLSSSVLHNANDIIDIYKK